jgi:transcriptional/translational regulatory protein YebC/TACO1
MAESGSVMFNFNRRGVCVLDGGDEEAVFEAAMEAGAEDIVPRRDGAEGWDVVCELDDFSAVQDALSEAGFTINEDTGLKCIPINESETSDEDADVNDKIIDALLDLDDVDAVYSQ